MNAIIIVRADEKRNPMRKINNIPFFNYVLNSLVDNCIDKCYLYPADNASSTKKRLAEIKKYFGSTFKKTKLYYHKNIDILLKDITTLNNKIVVLDANVILDFKFAQATSAVNSVTFKGVAVLTDEYYAKEYASCVDCCIDHNSAIFKYEHDNSGKYYNSYTTGLYIIFRDKLTKGILYNIINSKQTGLYGYLYRGLIITSEVDENTLSKQLLCEDLQLLARKGLSNIINSSDDLNLSKFDIFYFIFISIIMMLSVIYYNNNSFNAQNQLLFISIWMIFVVIMYVIYFLFQKKIYKLKNHYRLKYLKYFTKLMRYA